MIKKIKQGFILKYTEMLYIASMRALEKFQDDDIIQFRYHLYEIVYYSIMIEIHLGENRLENEDLSIHKSEISIPLDERERILTEVIELAKELYLYQDYKSYDKPLKLVNTTFDISKFNPKSFTHRGFGYE